MNRNGNTSASGQIEIITELRGFAAACVFLFHLVCVSNGYISGEYLRAVFQYGKYGVQFFFVISGFVIPYSMLRADYRVSDFFRFFQKRIVRIEPPYLVILALTVLFLYVRSIADPGRPAGQMPSWQQVMLHIGYLIPFSRYGWLSIVFWTLAIEFQFYLLFSLAYPVFVSGRWLRWGIYALLTATCFLSRDAGLFFYWSPIFLMGIHTALLKLKRIGIVEYWLTIAILFGVIVYRLGWPTSLFALSAILVIYFQPDIKSRLLHFLGNISYSLYLSHTLIAFFIINLGIRFTKHGYQKIFFVTLAVAATLFFSYLLYRFVEKPAKKWAAAINYRHE